MSVQQHHQHKFLYVQVASQAHYNLTANRSANEAILKPLGKKLVRFLVLSDTHNLHEQFIEKQFLPSVDACDVLIHAGDFTDSGGLFECMSFNSFLGKMASHFKYRIVVAGNHEFIPDFCSLLLTNATHFLKDSHITLPEFNINIYGSRYKPFLSKFSGRHEDMKQEFDDYPENVKIDVAVTHFPPKFKADLECDVAQNKYYNCVQLKSINQFFRRGSKPLAHKFRKNPPQVSIFGHNHEVYGFMNTKDTIKEKYPITFISAVSLDDYSSNVPTIRPPIIFDLVI